MHQSLSSLYENYPLYIIHLHISSIENPYREYPLRLHWNIFRLLLILIFIPHPHCTIAGIIKFCPKFKYIKLFPFQPKIFFGRNFVFWQLNAWLCLQPFTYLKPSAILFASSIIMFWKFSFYLFIRAVFFQRGWNKNTLAGVSSRNRVHRLGHVPISISITYFPNHLPYTRHHNPLLNTNHK